MKFEWEIISVDLEFEILLTVLASMVAFPVRPSAQVIFLNTRHRLLLPGIPQWYTFFISLFRSIHILYKPSQHCEMVCEN